MVNTNSNLWIIGLREWVQVEKSILATEGWQNTSIDMLQKLAFRCGNTGCI